MKIIHVFKNLVKKIGYTGIGLVKKFKAKNQVNIVKKDHEMTFSLNFEKKEKFYSHYVFFMIKPKKYKVEFSLDEKLWFEAMEYHEPSPVF
jgi:hypothetical protein